MDEVRRCLRVKRYSLRTEQAYTGWIRRFILASDKRRPKDMGAPEVERFLSALAVQGRVAASTQNQALSALLFLYREVLAVDLPWLDNVVRAKRPQRVPSVLSCEEVQRLSLAMEGRPWLLASLLYGTGMRLMECLRLRVKDVDFARNEITVREGKCGKDRRTVLPRTLLEPLQREIERARQIHQNVEPVGSVGNDLRRCVDIPTPKLPIRCVLSRRALPWLPMRHRYRDAAPGYGPAGLQPGLQQRATEPRVTALRVFNPGYDSAPQSPGLRPCGTSTKVTTAHHRVL
ncbi:MAG: phage integrase N-terminal SAM-like domain-containing protein [Xanthomonadaceae bacterium]|nr:phage integrase N-terminal SAM-like domain-containing protein [Xanthomonadaceae bacterium]MDP2184138.1 phage integrase N-terminal SAM-like domain-containing protein [Xanthomonadales bacterium]MDZ4116832.1 phage integrase N-terminal SAM-like domain-containing protein [Xanthomonadaceae bacterium]